MCIRRNRDLFSQAPNTASEQSCRASRSRVIVCLAEMATPEKVDLMKTLVPPTVSREGIS